MQLKDWHIQVQVQSGPSAPRVWKRAQNPDTELRGREELWGRKLRFCLAFGGIFMKYVVQ